MLSLRSKSETDAQKIERLEKVWSVLGPLRRIIFTFRFVEDYGDPKYNPEQEADKFAALAEEDGFTASKYISDCSQRVDIFAVIEPKLHTIIEAETKLKGMIDVNVNGVHYDGWSYPNPLNVEFWPINRNKNNVKANSRAAVSRGRVIFGETVLADPFGRTSGRNFQIIPSAFLHKACKQQPEDPQPTASAFAQWVYTLYGDTCGNENYLDRGKEVEKAVWALRRGAESSLRGGVLVENFPDWKLIHNGLHLKNGHNFSHHSISSLQVNGMPLKASPDLVYRNLRSGEIVIVEIKSSHMILPVNLWPNLWAQLWCYSQIDVALKAPKVTVVGEVWANRRVYIRRDDPRDVVSLRASLRRNPRAPAYDRFFRRLFDIYRGGTDLSP